MRRNPAYMLIAVCLATLSFYSSPVNAQTVDEVWVTVQDFAVLRVGPGPRFERLTVIAPGTTLRATGRTSNGDWLQVAYEGELPPEASELAEASSIDGVTYGWIAYWLLVWTGDILSLPVDGVETVAYARITEFTVTIGPETYIYVDGIDPSTRVFGLVSEATEVELTGRVGTATGGFFWLQFEYEGAYYWTGSWEIEPPRGYLSLPDGAYLYTFGRLRNQLVLEYNANLAIFRRIAGLWRRLDEGGEVSCNSIPSLAGFEDSSFSPADLGREPVFVPIVRALEIAVEQTNTAIGLFEDVCSREGAERFVTPGDIQAALSFIDEAERNLIVVFTLVTPLTARDPLLYGD